MANDPAQQKGAGGSNAAPTPNAAPKRRRRNRKRAWVAPYVKAEKWMLETEAYRSLTAGPRALLWDMARYHNGANNGELTYSTRQGADELHCAKSTVARWLAELMAKGFLIERTPADFRWKHGARQGIASKWELTWLDCEGKPARNDFTRWRPGKNQNTVPPEAQGGPVVKPSSRLKVVHAA